MNRLAAATLLALLLAAATARAAEPPVRWDFEEGTRPWSAHGARIASADRIAKAGARSLQIDVRFPKPATVSRPFSLDAASVGKVEYHVYLPADAPADVQALFFVKDKDGLWFQEIREEPLARGTWNAIEVDLAANSPRLRPSGHHRVWGSVVADTMDEAGIKLLSSSTYRGSLYLDHIVAHPAQATRPRLRVEGLHESARSVGLYERFEVTFAINRPVRNPFDPDHIRIDATVVDPTGRAIRVPAFYHQDFARRLAAGGEVLTPVGPGVWKVRFAPLTVGPHRYYLAVAHRPRADAEPEELVTGTRSFTCVPSGSPGFIRVSKKDPRYFEFSDGTWFYPIGHNLHSPSDDTPRAVKLQKAIGAAVLPDHGTFSYDRLFKKMAAHGENFAEVWMCAWWLGLEWVADWRHYGGLNRYNLLSAWRLDYVVDLARKHGLYLHLVIDNHGKCSTWCDPEWEDNPYARANGGFLDSPEHFFENERAKENYRKKLRYIIARWGHSTRIMGFELWSEVDLVGDSYDFHRIPAAARPKVQWHRDMADHLDRIDPWDHLVTTHFSTTYSRIRASLASIPGMDHITCDAYKFGRSDIISLVNSTARAFAYHGKPGMVTEYGGSPFGSSVAGLRADLHAGLWATYMTHTAGTPLLWWFQFIDADDLYWNYKALAAYHKGEDRRGKDLESGRVSVAPVSSGLRGISLQDQQTAYVWVYSRRAMNAMPRRDRAPLFENVVVSVSGLDPGEYHVEVWDCYKGGRITTLQRNVAGSTLVVPLPKFRIDVALKVKPVH